MRLLALLGFVVSTAWAQDAPRSVGKDLLVLDPSPGSTAHG